LRPRAHLREHSDHKGLYDKDPAQFEEYVSQTKQLVFQKTTDELDQIMQNFHSYLTRIGKADKDPAVATSVVADEIVASDGITTKHYKRARSHKRRERDVGATEPVDDAGVVAELVAHEAVAEVVEPAMDAAVMAGDVVEHRMKSHIRRLFTVRGICFQ